MINEPFSHGLVFVISMGHRAMGAQELFRSMDQRTFGRINQTIIASYQ